jgi:hypothetical protein
MTNKERFLSLKLLVDLPQTDIYLDKPCMLTVRLSNIGEVPIMVNCRMAVGFEKSLSRELYFHLLTADGEPARLGKNVYYEREFSLESDYRKLDPSEEISTTFDLFRWYLPATPGLYRLVAYYQVDEPLATPPKGIVHGVISSDVTTFTVSSSHPHNVEEVG